MKITEIRATPPLGQKNRQWTLLKIVTDEGITGLGEWHPEAGQEKLAALRKALVGQDPCAINWYHYSRWPYFSLFEWAGLGGGVEIALWDILGKKAGLPVWQLLGGKLRDRIRMYADCHSGEYWTFERYKAGWDSIHAGNKQLPEQYEPSAYARRACQMKDAGFTAMKFDVDVPNPYKLDRFDRSISRREHEHIVTIIREIRKALGPHVDFAIDLHGSFNAADALGVCKDVEDQGLLWIEDPVRWEHGNVAALKKITMQTTVPICTGEILYGSQKHRELIVEQACDLIEPDIPRTGGAIETRRVAELAEMYCMSVAPHNMDSTVTAYFAVHLCATMPNFLALEYHSGNIPLWSTMLNVKDPIRGGYIEVPDGPGLGIDLDEGEIARHVPPGQPLWL